MSKQLQISIPKPCHENWDKMTTAEKGRFCGSCQKQVIDFSGMSDRQIADFFKRPNKGSVCGRFMTDQVDRIIDIPRKRIPWLKYFFQILLPALFISRASGQQKMTKPTQAGRDTSTIRMTDSPKILGMIAPNIEPFKRDTGIIKDPVTLDEHIKGRIINEKGEPVPFASVEVGRTMNIFFSDEKGEFEIKGSSLPANRILRVSCHGFETKEVTLEKHVELITIQLEGNSENLDLVSSAQTFILGEISIKDPEKIAKSDSLYANDLVIQRDIPVPEDRNKIYLFPNPVLPGGNMTIGVHLLEEGYYTGQFLDLSGQLIQQKELWIDAETRLLNIEAPLVAKGNYLFVLVSRKTGKKITEKILIQ